MAQDGEQMDTFESEDLDCVAGKITFCRDHKIGEHDTSLKPKVYEGKFNGAIPVAIKAYQKAGDDKELKCVKRNFLFLSSEKNRHPNLIRYYGAAENEQFAYLATELCECSVAGLIARAEKLHILDHLSHKEILRQSAEAVRFLHGLGMIHRNLHPENFLIAQISYRDYLVKLTDFHSTKNWKDEPHKSGTRASDGWGAPDGPKSPRRTTNSKNKKTEHDEDPGTDVFILGCFFYYVLIGGKHPFGSRLNRGEHIRNSNHEAYDQHWNGSITGNANPANVFIWGVSLSGGKNPFGGPVNNKEGYVKEWENESPWWKREAFKALGLIKNSMIRYYKSDRKSIEDVLKNPYFNVLDIPHPYKIYDDETGKKKPGLCIIVSQEKFYQSWNDTPGMNVDAVRLSETFAGFGYDVLLYKNLTAQQMRDWITPGELKKKMYDLDHYNSLVVCILSHGDKGTVCGVDGQSVIINELRYAFNGGSCEALRDNKPKIFIILACQGTNAQKTQKEPETKLEPHQPKQVVYQMQMGDEQSPLIHHLTLMSTIEEFYAYGKPNGSGSWFIQTLCDQLQSEYGQVQRAEDEVSKKTRDLLQLFHSEVVPRVANEKIRIENLPDDETCKQTPESRSSLVRTIRFRQCKPSKNRFTKELYDGARSRSGSSIFQACRDGETKDLINKLSKTQLSPEMLEELKKITEKP